VDSTRSATKTLVSDLQAIDAPAGEDAQAAQQAVDHLAAQLRATRDTVTGAIDGVSGADGVLEAVSTVTGALATAKDEISSTVTTLTGLDVKGDLQKVFDDASACDPLKG
jgi:hypothetical protein